MLAKLEHIQGGAQERISSSSSEVSLSVSGQYRGSKGLDERLIKEIEKLYGFDKPLHERYFLMLKNYLVFDLGESFYRQKRVVELVVERLPVSISLGVWSTILIYLISIPLGIKKAVRHGSSFDVGSSFIIVLGSAIPVFLFAIVLIIFLAGGSYLQLFPLRGLVSEGFEGLSLGGKILDYLWHITLPVASLTIGGFASLTLLTKNSFLEEINKQYVFTRAPRGRVSEKFFMVMSLEMRCLSLFQVFPLLSLGCFLQALFWWRSFFHSMGWAFWGMNPRSIETTL